MSRSVFVLLFIHMIGRVSERKSYRYNSRIADSFGATSGITRVCTIITEDSFCFKSRLIRYIRRLKKGNSLGNSWMLWGMFALIALGLLCVGSIRAARAYHYESFLVLHFCMVL